jgi:CheY-like chemotaxis protein
MSASMQRDVKEPTIHRCVHADLPPGDTSIGGAQPEDDLIVNAGGARVIVVDDDPPLLHVISQMIVGLGYRCTTAVDALDALFHLNQTYHSLVITDYDMPCMDGFQLAEHIKRIHDSTKVILMTGYCEVDLKQRLAESTCVDGFLFKPFNLNVMRDTILDVCRFQNGRCSP